MNLNVLPNTVPQNRVTAGANHGIQPALLFTQDTNGNNNMSLNNTIVSADYSNSDNNTEELEDRDNKRRCFEDGDASFKEAN